MSNYGYYDSYAVGSAVGGIFAGMFVFLIVMIIIGLVLSVLNIIGLWKILAKGGKPGWGALIPVYNQYLLCDMVGVSPWWLLILLGSAVLAFIPFVGSLLSLAVSIYFLILLNVSLARSFGKEDGFAVGLILLQPFFYFFLGIKEENKYIGKKPMEDVVMKSFNKNDSTDNSTANSENTKFCTSCGSKMDKNSKFCPSCGGEVK